MTMTDYDSGMRRHDDTVYVKKTPKAYCNELLRSYQECLSQKKSGCNFMLTLLKTNKCTFTKYNL